MGCDIAVCFSGRRIGPEEIADTLRTVSPLIGRRYFILGSGKAEDPWQSFFSVWAEGSVDFVRLCESLSLREQAIICAAWKSEHGGAAGFMIFRSGVPGEAEDRSGGDYLLLPSRGVEQAFGQALPMDDADRLVFPECVLDGSEQCYELRNMTPSLVVPPITNLLVEDELGVEPVLPFEV